MLEEILSHLPFLDKGHILSLLLTANLLRHLLLKSFRNYPLRLALLDRSPFLKFSLVLVDSSYWALLFCWPLLFSFI